MPRRSAVRRWPHGPRQDASSSGFRLAQDPGKFLEYILRYCEKNQLPSLTVLVVNQETGLPGSGFPPEDVHSERERVFRFDWFGLVPPTLEHFADAVSG